MLLAMTLSSCSKNPMEVEINKSYNIETQTKVAPVNHIQIERIVDAIYYRSGDFCFRWGWPPVSKKYFYFVDTRMSIFIQNIPENTIAQVFKPNIWINSIKLRSISASYTRKFITNCRWCRVILRAWSCGYSGDRFGRASLEIQFYDIRGALLSRIFSDTAGYIIFRRVSGEPDIWRDTYEPDSINDESRFDKGL